jgi:hypothetical protein
MTHIQLSNSMGCACGAPPPKPPLTERCATGAPYAGVSPMRPYHGIAPEWLGLPITRFA